MAVTVRDSRTGFTTNFSGLHGWAARHPLCFGAALFMLGAIAAAGWA